MRQCRIGDLDEVAVCRHETRRQRARRGERNLLAENRLDGELGPVDRARRTQDVSSVVAEAIIMRRDQRGEPTLAQALAPSVQETLRESVRRDPHPLADALFPVMGPAIRKSISEALRGMLESFNQALEHSLSARGIKWRLEGFRTGKPFAEIVLMHSLLYRVEQVIDARLKHLEARFE